MEKPSYLYTLRPFSTPTVMYAMHVSKIREFSLQTLLHSPILLHEMICLDLVIRFFSPRLFLAVRLLTVTAKTGA